MTYSEDGYKANRRANTFGILFALGIGGWGLWDMSNSGYTFFNGLGIGFGIFILLGCLIERTKFSRFLRYRRLIFDEGIRSADLLAQQAGVIPKMVPQDLKNMINQKVLLYAKLTDDGELLELTDAANDTGPAFDGTCPGCGAALPRGTEVCEYCGRVCR